MVTPHAVGRVYGGIFSNRSTALVPVGAGVFFIERVKTREKF